MNRTHAEPIRNNLSTFERWQIGDPNLSNFTCPDDSRPDRHDPVVIGVGTVLLPKLWIREPLADTIELPSL